MFGGKVRKEHFGVLGFKESSQPLKSGFDGFNESFTAFGESSVT